MISSSCCTVSVICLSPLSSSLRPACVLSPFSHIRFCAMLSTAARQAPLSMRFSRQEYWSGLPCLPPGESSQSRGVSGIAGRFLTVWVTREALFETWILPGYGTQPLSLHFSEHQQHKVFVLAENLGLNSSTKTLTVNINHPCAKKALHHLWILPWTFTSPNHALSLAPSIHLLNFILHLRTW